ncbi:MAG TPA: flavodoxin family protein [Armatimonadota bacterium]|jgi:multimeric flavodoxin WrbA|nr:flavodoxin family protein [Armatimonadota bacterium]HOQ30824.1 flavodoxin family protein [Armatimonadota bacterium]HPO73685.1 flavodoxin family protein [Armatimonadota bacterium]HPT96910.1 flavodoxin family protein [Armatimonadota bacterium]
MRILGILGSPHTNGSTAKLLEALLASAREAGAQTERVDLAGLKMEFCRGCVQCYRTGRCVRKDDVEQIKEQMLAADGIVLGSPVYIRSVSAQLKVLMDRCAYFVHCFLLEGKYGAAVATAGGADQEETAEFANGFLRMCGAYTVGTASALSDGANSVREPETALAQAAALGRELVAAIREKRVYPDQDEERAPLYAMMKEMTLATREIWPAQYAEWARRGRL